MGKFQDALPKSLAKNVKAPRGKKRKFEPVVGASDQEKAKNLELLDQVTNKQPKMDVSKAVGKHMNQEDQARSAEKKAKSAKNKAGGKRKGGRKGGKGQFSKGKKSGAKGGSGGGFGKSKGRSGPKGKGKGKK